jgi:DNA processing protein
MDSKIKELKKENWPPLLFEIPNKPKKIYFKGEIPNWERKLLCVVGSRKYTNYGKEVTEMLIAGLSGYPVTIVSGLALGIDSIAHVNALKNKLPTIAIPGSGLSSNVLHPQSNKILANKIIENGGTLLSEYEEDFKATYWSFPQRNRIMAGMCHATLVIEAEKKSGTLITSRLATEYNRDVLTVPGSLWSSTSEGPLMLLRLGATPIRNSDDILDALNIKKVNNEEDDENKYFDCSEKEMLIIRILK